MENSHEIFCLHNIEYANSMYFSLYYTYMMAKKRLVDPIINRVISEEF